MFFPFREHDLQTGPGRPDASGTVGVGLEMRGPEHPQVAGADHEPVHHRVPQLLQQVQCQAGAAGMDLVEEADRRVEAPGFQPAGQQVPQ